MEIKCVAAPVDVCAQAAGIQEGNQIGSHLRFFGPLACLSRGRYTYGLLLPHAPSWRRRTYPLVVDWLEDSPRLYHE